MVTSAKSSTTEPSFDLNGLDKTTDHKLKIFGVKGQCKGKAIETTFFAQPKYTFEVKKNQKDIILSTTIKAVGEYNIKYGLTKEEMNDTKTFIDEITISAFEIAAFYFQLSRRGLSYPSDIIFTGNFTCPNLSGKKTILALRSSIQTCKQELVVRNEVSNSFFAVAYILSTERIIEAVDDNFFRVGNTPYCELNPDLVKTGIIYPLIRTPGVPGRSVCAYGAGVRFNL